MNDTSPTRDEPKGCTMLDLIALTIGVAIAASLDWYSDFVNSNIIVTALAPSWYTLANHGIELTQKACLALIPLIIARRMVYGGPLRAVEYLPILTGIFLLGFSISRWPILGLYDRSPSPPHMVLVNLETYYVFELSEIALGTLAALLVFFRRRRGPDWISALALAMAWQQLTTWLPYFYQQWANEQIMRLPTPTYVAISSTFLVQFPQYILAYFPLMVAVVDLTRGPRRQRTWVEWAAISIALPMPFLLEGRTIARTLLGGGYHFFDVFRTTSQVLALIASYTLARWTERYWRRFLEGSGVTASTGIESLSGGNGRSNNYEINS